MKTAINLLPQSLRRQQILRRRLIQWTSIISFVLLAGSAWHWNEMREYRQLKQQLDTLNREHAPTKTMLKQLVDMRQQLTELQQQESIAKELDTQRNALTLMGVISNTARMTNGRLRVTKFELSNFQGSQTGTVAGAAPKPAGLVLDGVSLDNPSVAELLDGLQKSRLFNRVELLTLKEREDKDAVLRDYQVKCEF